MIKQYTDIQVELSDDFVAVVEIQRPPHNFFDKDLIEELVVVFRELDENPNCRATVLASQGKAFCAGANFSSGPSVLENRNDDGSNPLYAAAIKLFDIKKPIVGAIHGAAVGGGLGLALIPDFRVTCTEAKFCANFTKLGIHPGFGLSHTLPSLIGQQKSSLMFYTSRRIKGDQAVDWGLADVLTDQQNVRNEALKLAREIAENAPLATVSTRATLRQGLAQKIKQQIDHENKEQVWLSETADFKEGLKAVSERRTAKFIGQ